MRYGHTQGWQRAKRQRRVLKYLGNPELLPYHEDMSTHYEIISCVKEQFHRLKLDRSITPQERAYYKDYFIKAVSLPNQSHYIYLKEARVKACYNSFFVIKDGSAWAFGKCDAHQLGVQSQRIRLRIPVNLRAFSPDLLFLDVDVSSTHGVAISSEEKIYGWGRVESGSIVFQEEGWLPRPCEINEKGFVDVIQTSRANSEKRQDYKIFGFKQVVSRDLFTVYIYRDYVFTSGREKSFRLGTGSEIVQEITCPFPISTPRHFNIEQVAAGRDFCLMLDSFGIVYGWGSNEVGQLTLPPPIKHSSKPTKLTVLQGEVLTQIGCGQQHAMALSVQGAIFSWGNLFSDDINYIRPRIVQHPLQPACEFAEFSCGESHVLALDKSGRLFGWGVNRSRCVSRKHPEGDCIRGPILVSSEQEIVKSFSCGNNFSVVLVSVFNNQLAKKQQFSLNCAKGLLRKFKQFQKSSRDIVPQEVPAVPLRTLSKQSSGGRKGIQQHFKLNQKLLVEGELQEMTKRLKGEGQSRLKLKLRELSRQKSFMKKESWEHKMKRGKWSSQSSRR